MLQIHQKNQIKYLGQYTHRIAISNQRIKEITQDKVRFLAKDYRDNATQKLVEMSGVEFLRRFIQHILPKGFVRIRRFGIYNASTKRNLDLQFVSAKSDLELLLIKKAKKRRQCPVENAALYAKMVQWFASMNSQEYVHQQDTYPQSYLHLSTKHTSLTFPLLTQSR